MTSLTDEEKNFLRIYKLVSGIAPKAARSKFDIYFPPSTLDATLKAAETSLKDYQKKGWINSVQMNILFPVTGSKQNDPPACSSNKGSTSSVNYDITLMICLLRNLSTLPSPLHGYDVLPPSTEISDGADLARVKFYRNKMAHSDKDTMTTREFNVIWKNLAEAVTRLGGVSYKQACDHLYHSNLDNDIVISLRKEIQNLRTESDQKISDLSSKTEDVSKRNDKIAKQMEGIKRKAQCLTTKVTRVKRTSDDASTRTKYLTTQLAEMKQCAETCNCYDFHLEEIEEWEKKNEKFVNRDAVEFAFEMIEASHKITVTGIPGTGKSALIQHIALFLRDNQGYSIIPCYSPSDITEHYKMGNRQVFVINDVCGRYVLNQYDLDPWKKREKSLSKILQKGNIKILTSSRLQVFQEIGFQNLAFLSENVCDLSSARFKLSFTNKQEIALKYMPGEIVQSIIEELDQCEFVPLMCSLYKPDSNVNPRDSFQNPTTVYQEELDEMLKESNKFKICALFLFIVFNGCITEDCLKKESRQKLESIFEIFKINRGTCVSEIIDQLNSMSNTYLTKSDKKFKIVHDKIFDIICFYFGRKLQKEVIRFAHCKSMYERTSLESEHNVNNEHEIRIEKENEVLYFQRILEDISSGNFIEVFYSSQMSCEHFRSQFITFLNKQDRDCIKTILTTRNIVQKGGVDSAFHIVCSLGYCDIVEFLLTIIDDINIFYSDEFPPLHQACLNGHKAIIQKFIEKGADINREGYNGLTPLIWSCTGGWDEIVLLLLQNGADINKEVHGRTVMTETLSTNNCTIFELLLKSYADVCKADITYLFKACEFGSVSIAEFLIQRGADLESVNLNDETPLIVAVKFNHISVAESLIKAGAKVNVHDGSDISPLVLACRCASLPMMELLIHSGAKVNASLDLGWTVLMESCLTENTNFINCLISAGASVNQSDEDGKSPLMIVCELGYSTTAGLLISNGADINQTDSDGFSPLTLACDFQHLDIIDLIVTENNVDQIVKEDVKMTLLRWLSNNHNTVVTRMIARKGLDFNMVTNGGKTLLIESIEKGYHSVVYFLVNNGSDVNQCDDNGDSPLMKACQTLQCEMIEFFICKGANVNVTNNKGESPLMKTYIANINFSKVANSKEINGKEEGHFQISCHSVCKQIADILFTKGALHELVYKLENLQQLKFFKLNKDLNVGKTLSSVEDIVAFLLWTCQSGKDVFVDILLDMGLDINMIDDNTGDSPLTLSIKTKEYYGVICLLIDKGVDVNKWNGNGELPLNVAIKLRNDNVVGLLLKSDIHGVDINRHDRNGDTPLTVAIKQQHIFIVKNLLGKGADVNKCDRNGDTPLILAFKQNDMKVFQILLDKGVDVNKCDRNGDTPLILAIKEKNINVFHILVDKGVDVNKCDKNGDTPLTLVIKKQENYIVRLLLQSGVDIYRCDGSGDTPLQLAGRLKNNEVVRLLDGVTNVNKYDENGDTPLIVAIKQNHEADALIFVDWGADVNKCDGNGDSPLIVAIKQSDTYLFSILVNNGADLNKCDRNGEMPLTLAIKKQEKNIVRLLLQKGVDVYRCDRSGKSPLQLAVQLKNKNIKTTEIFRLLDGVTNVNKCDKHGNTPLILAIKQHHSFDHDDVGLFADRGADVNKCDGNGDTPLILAIKQTNDNLFHKLLYSGADVNKCDGNGDTPLILAIKQTNDNLFHKLLYRGADVNKCGGDGDTPLIMAIKQENISVVSYLLDQGVDVSKCNRLGDTPLTVAIKVNHHGIFDLILKEGVDLNRSDRCGDTPLILAIKLQNIYICCGLLNRKVDLSICDGKGDTPLEVAMQQPNENIIRLLQCQMII